MQTRVSAEKLGANPSQAQGRLWGTGDVAPPSPHPAKSPFSMG